LRKTSKTQNKKDRPYKNGVKKNGKKQSDVSNFQKVNKFHRKGKFLNSLNSKNSGSDRDMVINNLQMQMSQNKNQMTHCGI